MARKRSATTSTASQAARKDTLKRARSVAAMQSFLETLSRHGTTDDDNVRGGDVDASVAAAAAAATAAVNSPLLLQAVTRCHERFLRVVAAELAASASNNSAGDNVDDCSDNGGITTTASTKVNRVVVASVESAMRELGMDDILREAALERSILIGQQHATSKNDSRTATGAASVAVASSKWKRNHARRTKQWSEEELAEQERLLASSKQKLQQAG